MYIKPVLGFEFICFLNVYKETIYKPTSMSKQDKNNEQE